LKNKTTIDFNISDPALVRHLLAKSHNPRITTKTAKQKGIRNTQMVCIGFDYQTDW